MNIALNATSLLSPLTGIGQYVYQLANGLLNNDELDMQFFYASYWSQELRHKPVDHIVQMKAMVKKIVPHAYLINRYKQQFYFNRGVKSKLPMIYHEPNFIPFKFKGPTIVTIHDLSWIRFPETHPQDRVAMMNRYFEPGLQRTDKIITDSEFVKNELIDVFGIASSKIIAIPLGVEQIFHERQVNETQAVLAKHDLTHGHYLLGLGTLEPRKNIQATIQAFMMLAPNIRKQYPLILVGMKGWNTSTLEQQIAPLVRAGEIRQMGYLPREELACIVAGALTLIFPSVYEGFGLPPLEAMASAVPVIASNVSSLPEVVGDTGFLIDPHDAHAIKESIELLIDSPDTRHHLGQKAKARSAQFTWEHCVNKTLELYREIYQQYM